MKSVSRVRIVRGVLEYLRIHAYVRDRTSYRCANTRNGVREENSEKIVCKYRVNALMRTLYHPADSRGRSTFAVYLILLSRL